VHLVFAVSDVDRAYAFYREVFGWTSHIEWPGEYTELVVSGEDRLGLCRRDVYAKIAGAQPVELNGHASTAYLYVRVEDLDKTIDRLGRVGARKLSPRQERSWDEEAAYFADPDGNVVAVARRLY